MFCPSCGVPLPSEANYCSACGARSALRGTAARSALTERKFVTVMFIDMVGSLNAIRDKDPEDAHEVLTAVQKVMMQAVHAYGGVVADVQGDGVMAIFGAPIAQEDHATRACKAALRLHATRGQASPDVALRVGINSGEVAVGSTLNDFALDYTATGAVVHIAARLQAIAPANATVITQWTAALVRDVMHTESMGSATLKGLELPLELFRLIGPRSAPGLSPANPSPVFVGREAALSVLEAAFDAAAAGRGRVIGVSGEAGIGKTSLVDRFVAGVPGEAAFVRTAAEHRTSVASLQLFADLMNQLLEQSARSSSPSQPTIRAWLAALGLNFETHEAPLLDLLGVERAESWLAFAPLARHDLIGSAVIAVLQAESRRRHLVVVLEDVQRADSATIEVIDRLIRSVAEHRVLLLVAFRPEFDQTWDRTENYCQLTLDRLSDQEMTSLIVAFLGVTVPPRLAQQLLRWSRGNPLFLRESVRAMSDAGAVGDADAAARIPMPHSIGAVIAARIDRLPPVAKRALLAASVLGSQFGFEVLSSVSEVTGTALAAQLDALSAADFVDPLEPSRRTYGFKHALFQEVAYATLLRRQRRDLHQAAFKVLIALHQGLAHRPVEELARHSFGGELWAEAVLSCAEAGRRAASRYANREAAMHLENAIAALAQADPFEKRLDEAISLRLALRSVSIPLLRLDRVATILAEARSMAERLDDRSQLVRISAFLAGHAYLTRNPGSSLELCRDAMALADQLPDRELRIAPTLYMAQAEYGLGKYRRVIALLEHDPSLQDAKVTGVSVGVPLRPLLMRSYWLAIAWAELGRFDDAEALAKQMERLADDHQPFERLYAQTAHGFILLLRGVLDRALYFSEAALATADDNDIAFIIPVVASQVGFLLASMGRVREGLALAHRAMRKADEIGSNAGRARWCARLSEVCLCAGDLAEGQRYADMAVRLAEDSGEWGYLCSALRSRAKGRVLDGDLSRAGQDLARAAQLAKGLRAGPALAKCHFDVGALAQRAGRTSEARQSFKAAQRGFAKFRMVVGQARVETALASLSGGLTGPVATTFFGSAE